MDEDPRDTIAALIADYRQDEIAQPNAQHVDRWAQQLSADVREPVLHELAHILAKTYVSKAKMLEFIATVLESESLAGDDPASFWRGVKFLRLQQAGNSQNDMLALFDQALEEAYGFNTADCDEGPDLYVYLDDGVFTGGRVRQDVISWVREAAPDDAKLAIIAIAMHSGGQYYTDQKIKEAAQNAGKTITLSWWRALMIEDQRRFTNESDVLRPKAIPAEARAYVDGLEFDPVLRQGGSVGPQAFFSSAGGRDLVEQEFLKAGIEVKRRCPRLPNQMRPLGSTLLQTTGFGTMFVTYRNIPNNTPLVLWAGDPWYPLFPRKTN